MLEHGRMDAARQLAQLLQRAGELVARARDTQLLGLPGRGGCRPRSAAAGSPPRRAAAARRRAGCARAAGARRRRPRRGAGASPAPRRAALRSSSRSFSSAIAAAARDDLDQLRILVERGVVDQRAAVEHRVGAACRRRHGDRRAGGVGVGVRVPIGHDEALVAGRLRQAELELRPAHRPDLPEQVAPPRRARAASAAGRRGTPPGRAGATAPRATAGPAASPRAASPRT